MTNQDLDQDLNETAGSPFQKELIKEEMKDKRRKNKEKKEKKKKKKKERNFTAKLKPSHDRH